MRRGNKQGFQIDLMGGPIYGQGRQRRRPVDWRNLYGGFGQVGPSTVTFPSGGGLTPGGGGSTQPGGGGSQPGLSSAGVTWLKGVYQTATNLAKQNKVLFQDSDGIWNWYGWEGDPYQANGTSRAKRLVVGTDLDTWFLSWLVNESGIPIEFGKAGGGGLEGIQYITDDNALVVRLSGREVTTVQSLSALLTELVGLANEWIRSGGVLAIANTKKTAALARLDTAWGQIAYNSYLAHARYVVRERMSVEAAIDAILPQALTDLEVSVPKGAGTAPAGAVLQNDRWLIAWRFLLPANVSTSAQLLQLQDPAQILQLMHNFAISTPPGMNAMFYSEQLLRVQWAALRSLQGLHASLNRRPSRVAWVNSDLIPRWEEVNRWWSSGRWLDVGLANGTVTKFWTEALALAYFAVNDTIRGSVPWSDWDAGVRSVLALYTRLTQLRGSPPPRELYLQPQITGKTMAEQQAALDAFTAQVRAWWTAHAQVASAQALQAWMVEFRPGAYGEWWLFSLKRAPSTGTEILMVNQGHNQAESSRVEKEFKRWGPVTDTKVAGSLTEILQHVASLTPAIEYADNRLIWVGIPTTAPAPLPSSETQPSADGAFTPQTAGKPEVLRRRSKSPWQKAANWTVLIMLLLTAAAAGPGIARTARSFFGKKSPATKKQEFQGEVQMRFGDRKDDDVVKWW